MKTSSALALFLAALASSVASAHTDDALDAQTAANGGQMRMAGPYHYELVVAKDSKGAKENPIVVYLTDHAGKKVPSAGATGIATLLAGKSKATASLVPDGDNRLKGSAHYASVAEMKVVVSIIFPGRNAEQARFTPLATGRDTPAEHNKH